MAKRDIPATHSIESYMHCRRCLEEKPEGISPAEWQQNEVGFTDIGLQVWCRRHQINVVHIDFEYQQHPANLKGE